ncbi:DNA gyrase inhibitor [Microlunatus endophyticus]|uniref:DNA gyrase inhibitor n=1 Tax=Microlunatus endophyticus TaxID=1716077 RepID=A0A917S9D4_9ACTN|nr:GyrI-like domain-containing protein [Microlunatus endophyticus]GGL62835.1 DNA gyrase inhibitor [Microlunatus endophyticus]
MTREPEIVEREAMPYVAITTKVTMDTIGAVVPPLNQQVQAWLRSQGIAPADSPFWKYNVIDMERGLEIEAGVTVAEPVQAEGPIHAGVLPAGRYVRLLHIGHPDTLMDATARLLKWADAHGLEWDVSPSAEGERWGCRLEIYRDEPGQDMNDWETELSFRLAG